MPKPPPACETLAGFLLNAGCRSHLRLVKRQYHAVVKFTPVSPGFETPLVQLVPYNPDFLGEFVLWTESKDLGDRFRCIRMVNDISLNFDAFNGDEDHVGVHDGIVIVLWEWLEGKNQRWKIVPY